MYYLYYLLTLSGILLILGGLMPNDVLKNFFKVDEPKYEKGEYNWLMIVLGVFILLFVWITTPFAT